MYVFVFIKYKIIQHTKSQQQQERIPVRQQQTVKQHEALQKHFSNTRGRLSGPAAETRVIHRTPGAATHSTMLVSH